jgi:hypothetical protein
MFVSKAYYRGANKCEIQMPLSKPNLPPASVVTAMTLRGAKVKNLASGTWWRAGYATLICVALDA